MAGIAPIVWTPIRDALYDWLNGQLGVEVDWARQDAPELPYPYGLLDIIAGPVVVHHDRIHRVDQGDGMVKEYVVGDRTCTLSVDVLVSFENLTWDPETDGFARAALAQASLGRPEVLQTLGAAGIGILEIGPVQDRRTPLEAGWISRAGFDVTILLVSLIDPGSVEAIETVEITADMGSVADFTRQDFGLDSLAMRFYGETAITAAAPTTVVTPGTFLQVAGTYAAGELADFDSPASGRIRYVGTENRRHRVSIAGSAITAAAPVAVKIGISKNGAQPTKYFELDVDTAKVAGAVEDLLDLAPNDYLEAWLTADGAVAVTVAQLSLIAIA